ncbi:hypothetical protein [Tabrizicola sp.]|uniref:hypothetical protein n=1 Tax=Tabrizicola sp. TaxID=2005166 RepID=UPI0027351085|nr:hypothetical protein [Tabrizicola sp.]MDP3197574.1 hypothetical protein [Tabrizicola sp.]
MTRLLPLAALLLSIVPAQAQEAQEAQALAEYWTNNGSLPPEYAWETTITIGDDGRLILKHCKGYQTDGCKTRRAKVTPEALVAIRSAAIASGLADKPARDTEMPIVGSGLTGGVVYLDGVKIILLEQPADPDVPRVGKVLDAIAAAIPARFDRFLNAE